jgi:hypothetical protein
MKCMKKQTAQERAIHAIVGAKTRTLTNAKKSEGTGNHVHTYGNSSYYPNTCTTCGANKKQ